MEPGGRDSRFNLGYSMNLLSGETPAEIYGNPNLGRPSTSLQQLSPRHTMVSSACNRGIKSDMYDDRAMSSQGMGLDSCVNEINEDSYSMQSKKSPPSNGKKTKGRVKIKMEYIENKLRRYTTFSKRKTGIMKKAYELSTLTGTQVMLLVASETGHVYTFATRKLQPMITSEAGKALIQTCLNSPDPPAGSAGGDQRMSATGFEETELTYNISDDDSKNGDTGSDSDSEDMEITEETPEFHEILHQQSQAQDPLSFSPADEDQSTVNTAVPAKNLDNNIKRQSTPKSSSRKHQNDVPVPSSTTSTSNFAETLPLIVPTTANTTSTPLTVPTSVFSTTTIPTTSVGANTSALSPVGALPPTGAATNRLQALPLVLQTPAGMGYASTPDGMILGLLQGPNITQPQLVAIPMSSNDNISGPDSSDSCSDGDMDTENPLSAFAPPDTPSFTSISPPSSPFSPKHTPATSTPPPSSTSTSTAKSQSSQQNPPMLSPLVYQTPQGMMYAATQSGGGVILSLAPSDGSNSHPQFITIPLSMVASNGQGELDLSKRK